MFCKKCGAMISESANFCKKCGVATTSPSLTNRGAKANTVRVLKGIGKKKLFIIVVVATVVIAAAIGIPPLMDMLSYTTVNMAQLGTPMYEGLDEEGVAYIKINKQEQVRLFQQLAAAGQIMTEDEAAQLLDIGFAITPNGTLKNGDEITITARYNPVFFEQNKLKAVNEMQTQTVEGLEVAKEVDVFEGLKVKFLGRSPLITCVFETGACSEFTQKHVTFETVGTRFAKGTPVTVRAVYSDEERAAEKVRVLSDEKQYPVTSKEAYLDSLEGVQMKALHQALYDQLRLEEGAANDYFANVPIMGYYAGTKEEKELGDAFLVLRDDSGKEYNGNIDPIYNQYALYVQCTIGTNSLFGGARDDKKIDVLLVANNLYTDQQGTLHWSDLILTEADEAKAGSLKSAFIKKNQDAFNLISSDEKKVTTIKSQTSVAANQLTENQEAMASDSESSTAYILPDSGTRELSYEDIQSLSSHQLMLARNEILARHGRKFNDTEIREYFESKSWYNGTVAPENFAESTLSNTEHKNIALIKKYE